MKRIILGILSLMIVPLLADYTCITIVNKPAPAFTAQAMVAGEISQISLADYEGKNKILIFYPADFSFICPTELFAFQDKLAEFEKRNTVLIAFSVDQIYAHQKWLETPKNEGGIQGITYPIVSDINKSIAHAYHVLDEKDGVALRGVVIIDTNNIVQALNVYNTSIGRNIDEVLRVLDAVLFTQEHGHVCPANWEKGDEGMEASHDGLKKYLKEKENNEH